MSRIADLIKQFCPNGVEIRKLGEYCEVFNGFAFKSELFNTVGEGLPLIRIRDVNTGLSGTYYSGWYDEKFVVNDGDLLISMDGDFKAIRWSNGSALLNQRVCRLQNFSDGLSPSFVYYILVVQLAEIQRSTQSSTVKHLSSKQLQNLGFPVPPLEVQREIVRILDSFAALQSELAAELDAEVQVRRLQYMHYRDALLTFPEDDDVKWHPMGDVGQFIRGRRFTKRDYVNEGGIPVIHYGEIYTHFGTTVDSARSQVRSDMAPNLRFARPNDVILTDVGETVDDVGKAVAWLGSTDVAIHDHCYAFRHSMNPAFVSYYMQTNRFRLEKARYVARTKVKTLLMNGLAKVCIPTPPLSEQERIVAILDAYEKVLAALSISLPSERYVRSKQYEHYRDRLLAFEELGVFVETVP